MPRTVVLERVRGVIEQSGLNQSEFARRVGLDGPKLSKALSGRRRFAPEELVRIAQLGGVDVSWLLDAHSGFDGAEHGVSSARQPQPVRVGLDAVRPRIAEICERYGIVQLAVFGSAARGDAGPDSDVDLLYTRAAGNDLGMRYFDLRDELEELIGRSVDLVSKDGLNRLIRDDVLAEAKDLYVAT